MKLTKIVRMAGILSAVSMAVFLVQKEAKATNPGDSNLVMICQSAALTGSDPITLPNICNSPTNGSDTQTYAFRSPCYDSNGMVIGCIEYDPTIPGTPSQARFKTHRGTIKIATTNYEGAPLVGPDGQPDGRGVMVAGEASGNEIVESTGWFDKITKVVFRMGVDFTPTGPLCHYGFNAFLTEN